MNLLTIEDGSWFRSASVMQLPMAIGNGGNVKNIENVLIETVF